MPSSIPRPKVSIEDVAAAAGVSIMTVSRALRGIEGVSAAKRAEIEQLAASLGYRPNRNAISLAVAHSNLIGISIPTLFNDVFAELLEGMRPTFDRAGFETVIDTSDYSVAREAAFVERMIDWRPAGIILCGVDHAPEVSARLREVKIPTLQVWDVTHDPIDVCVGFDHEGAGRALGEHLIAVGYRIFAFIGVEEGRDPRAEKRLRGLRQALEQAGLPAPEIVRIDHRASFEAGRLGMEQLLARSGEQPVEVVCFLNDHMAFGGLSACRRHELHVPDDIGLCGYNGLGINAVLVEPLTTVRTDRRELGRIAAQRLLARIKGVAVTRVEIHPTQIFQGLTTRTVDPSGQREAG